MKIQKMILIRKIKNRLRVKILRVGVKTMMGAAVREEAMRKNRLSVLVLEIGISRLPEPNRKWFIMI